MSHSGSISISFACVVVMGLVGPDCMAHPLKTKKTAKLIIHTHYTKGGHATSANGTGPGSTEAKPVPDANHAMAKCRLQNDVIQMV